MKGGLVQEWLTTNYDGLAQKAGCPQEKVAELHGSWFDPSNPQLGKRGTMRPDLQERVRKAAEAADLILVVGSTLSNISIANNSISSPTQAAEFAAIQAAQRSLAGLAMGVVVINLQHTPIDPLATIRIFADADHALVELAKLLDLAPVEPNMRMRNSSGLIPYDGEGSRLMGSEGANGGSVLRLAPGEAVRLSRQHNCRAAGQASRQHIGVGEMVREGSRVVQRARGDGRVVRYCATQRAWELEIEGVKMLLGYWWLEAAVRGGVNALPVFNIGKHNHNQNSIKNTIKKIEIRENIIFQDNVVNHGPTKPKALHAVLEEEEDAELESQPTSEDTETDTLTKTILHLPLPIHGGLGRLRPSPQFHLDG